MSTSPLPSPDPLSGGNAAPLPQGWIANWSADHNAWFYVYTPTGLTQWEYPTPHPDQPQYSPAPDHNNPANGQPLYSPGPEGIDAPAQDGDRGLGKAALALGGGFLAASSLKNKFGDGHHGSGNHGMGKMAQSIAAAGAGAVGAKIFGLFGNKPQKEQNQHSPTPPQTQVHVYPVYVPGPQGVAPQGNTTPGPPQWHNGQPTPVPMNMGANYAQSHHMGAAPLPHHLANPYPAPTGMGNSVPPLHIYGAAFADKDVTQIVRSLITPQQTLVLTGETLVEKFGDPWPEVTRKMFNVLYSYGDRPMELLAAETSTTNIEIKHEAISKKRMDFCQTPPSRIIACVWGFENALTVPRLEQLEKDGEMEGSGGTLGRGGFYDWDPKTLVCYYRRETGEISMVFCREGGTIRLPWNPLAKWS